MSVFGLDSLHNSRKKGMWLAQHLPAGDECCTM